MKRLMVQIERKTMLTTRVVEFVLRSPEPLSYQPGQFIQLRLAGDWRAYSIADMPDEFSLTIVVLLIDGGRASRVLEATQPGDSLPMLPPNGWFAFQPGKPTCMVGTSTGIIPLYSMAKQALQAGERRQLRLLFGARNQQQLFYTEQLAALERRFANFQVVYALSQPATGWQGYHGRVSDYLQQYFAGHRHNRFYVSAWHGTVESLEALLLRLGVPRQELLSEYYD